MCDVEDLEAEQDELDSSGGSMLGLLDTTPVGATPKPVKRRVSGVTGGRSGLKLSRRPDGKPSKSSEPETKKSPRRSLQSSAGCKRVRRNLSAESKIGELSSDVDEKVESGDKADGTSHKSVEELENQTAAGAGQPQSSEKRGMQRITRRNSDLILAESDSVQGEHANNSDDFTVTDSYTKTE